MFTIESSRYTVVMFTRSVTIKESVIGKRRKKGVFILEGKQTHTVIPIDLITLQIEGKVPVRYVKISYSSSVSKTLPERNGLLSRLVRFLLYNTK